MVELHYSKSFLSKIEKEQFSDYIFSKLRELSSRNREHIREMKPVISYGNNMYVLKTETPKTRVVIEEVKLEIEEEQIYVLIIRDIILSKRFEYYWNRVNKPLLKRGEWTNNSFDREEEIKQFKIKFLQKKKKKEEKKSILPAELDEWLKDYSFKIRYDVFESESWVKFSLNQDEKEGLRECDIKIFRLLLKDIVDGDLRVEITNLSIKKRSIYSGTKYGIGIIYEKIIIDNDTIWLLHNGAHTKEQKQYWEKSLENIKAITLPYDNTIKAISRFAFRAYPEWTLKDDSLWIKIQSNDERGNLSLLPEQLDFLLNFKFPSYINGQAGSGKSTMLYYLFANAYYYYCQNEIKGELIFLTENEFLLKDSKNVVFELLSSNPEFDGISDINRGTVDRYFSSFRDFLHNVLPEEDKQKYPLRKYLDFSKFKTLYEDSKLDKAIKGKYSAEEVWFTIRTYIYGYNSSKEITSSTYQEIVKRDSRVLPSILFKEIENKVLPFYKKLISKGYWDKLQLIKHIEQHNLPLKKYALIICDEAQDFCRVELSFILNLSEYIRYDLSKAHGVPIVFAGDPNQTVNPTGFRGAEITSMLYEQLKEASKFNALEKITYNPSFNYRSTRPVVSLANFVQYYRKKTLGISTQIPQKAKRPEPIKNFRFNTFFDYENITSNLKDKLTHKIFIIPVDAGQKQEYIGNSNLLSEKIEIKTSVEAKGAEYEQVVLYGFGEYYIKEFEALSHEREGDDNIAFRKRFFFNKLYVGITRAKTELIIIDSQTSVQLFWEKLIKNTTNKDSVWSILDDGQDIIEYNPGTLDNVIESTSQIGLENANKDKNQGIYDKNPARLRAAANQFFKLGFKDEYFVCLAISAELKGDWGTAGDYYITDEMASKKWEEAMTCYWKGMLIDQFKKATKLKDYQSNPKQDLQLMLIGILEGVPFKDVKKEIGLLLTQKELLREILKGIDWRDKIIQKLIIVATKLESRDIKRDMVRILETIHQDTDTKLKETIAELYYNVRNFEEAVNFWDDLDQTEHKNYAKAQIEIARSSNHPVSQVAWLGKLSDLSEGESDKRKAENEILKIISENTLSDNNDNDYTKYSYQSLLTLFKEQIPYEEGKLYEKALEKKPSEIVYFYEYLLTRRILSKEISEYILERWAWAISIYKRKDKKEDWVKELNAKYQKIAQKTELVFVPFTISEIKQIEKYPHPKESLNQKHIDAITIYNFRGFQELDIQNLGTFNLIVGDNNVGKTSLLEALSFTNNAEEYVKRLCFLYNERLNHNENYNFKPAFINDFISNVEGVDSISFDVRQKRKIRKYLIKNPLKNSIIDELELSYRKVIDPQDYLEVSSLGEKEIIDISLIIKRLKEEKILNIPFIPFGKGHGGDLATLYLNKIHKKRKLRESFIKNLEGFIPHICGIIPDTNENKLEIEEESNDGDYITTTLHQYGEGANKLFRILLQIALHKNDKLMIDEIDAGIHHSRFLFFWKTIILAAKNENVQLFVTTHNNECINYFIEALKEIEKENFKNAARVIQLEKISQKQITITTYNFHDIEYAYNSNQEIRGEGAYE